MSKIIKAILLGCVGVGKTNLINACCGRPFLYNERSTITSNYISKVVEVIMNVIMLIYGIQRGRKNIIM